MSEALVPVEVIDDAVAICGLQESNCFCGHPVGHDGAHRCACGGSWQYDADGQFEIVAFPGTGWGRP
jgi:hypothetical protein